MDSVRLDCGVNRYRLLFESDIIILLFILDFFLVPRLAVSHDDRGILAVPLDNRHIKLYDLKGSRLAHSSKNSRTVSLSLPLPLSLSLSLSLPPHSFIMQSVFIHYDRVTIVWCTVLLGHLTVM